MEQGRDPQKRGVRHAKLESTIDSSFDKASISSSELESLVAAAKGLLNHLATSSGRPSYVFNLTQSADFTNMLEVLLSNLAR